jgi:cytidylate kinase
MKQPLFVVTISHQLGCGGALVGEKVAQKLSVPFVDRQILREIADQLNMAEENLENREERLSGFWAKFSRAEMLSDPIVGISQDYLLTDRELFEFESEYILRVVQKSSAVILGRGGRHILRDHPSHVAVFVNADLPERIERVAKTDGISEDAARQRIEKSDRERAAYIKSFTKENLLDLRYYDLCVNTSAFGVDRAAELVYECVESRLKCLT